MPGIERLHQKTPNGTVGGCKEVGPAPNPQ